MKFLGIALLFVCFPSLSMGETGDLIYLARIGIPLLCFVGAPVIISAIVIVVILGIKALLGWIGTFADEMSEEKKVEPIKGTKAEMNARHRQVDKK